MTTLLSKASYIPWPFEYSPDQRGGSPAGKGRQKDDHAWKEVKNQAKSPQKSKPNCNKNPFLLEIENNAPGSTMAARKAEKRRAKVRF